MEKFKIGQAELVVKLGDITKENTDAIVNAANSSLMGGGGVDGAIHRAGGPTILEECKKYVEQNGRLPTGRAMITTGGNLPAKYVIHTVGPIYRGIRESEDQMVNIRIAENQAKELRDCYVESLKLADQFSCKSIAFPSISTGAYRYPLAEAAPIAIQAVKEYLSGKTGIREVVFVLFNEETCEAYKGTAGELL